MDALWIWLKIHRVYYLLKTSYSCLCTEVNFVNILYALSQVSAGNLIRTVCKKKSPPPAWLSRV